MQVVEWLGLCGRRVDHMSLPTLGWYGSLLNNGSQRDGRADAGDSGTVYRARNRHIKPPASMLRVAGCFVSLLLAHIRSRSYYAYYACYAAAAAPILAEQPGSEQATHVRRSECDCELVSSVVSTPGRGCSGLLSQDSVHSPTAICYARHAHRLDTHLA